MVLCLLAVSCQKEMPHSQVEGDTNGPFTLTLESTTATTVSFTGSIDLKKYDGYEEVGIIYSLDEVLDSQIDTSNMVKITIIDQNCVFNKKIKNLLHESKYYYTSYVRLSNGLFQLGNINTFETEAVKFSRSSVTKTRTTATLSGSIDLCNDDLDCLDFGVMVSTDPELESDVMKYGFSISEDGDYSVTVDNLNIETRYYYSIYVKQGRHVTYGTVESFVTSGVNMTAYASDISYSSAQLYGDISFYNEDNSQYIEYGLLVSLYEDLYIESNSCRRIRVNEYVDESGKYSVPVTGLSASTKYYYCYYALQGGKCYYGPYGNFTTQSLSLTLNKPTCTQTKVSFSGSFPSLMSDAYISIQYSEYEDELTNNSYYLNAVEMSMNYQSGSVSAEVGGLKFNTTYYYRYCINLNGSYHYGPTKSFTTQNVTVNLYAQQYGDGEIRFYGNVNLTESGAIEVGVEYYPTGYEYYYGVSNVALTSYSGDFSYVVSGLVNGYEYTYRYYVYQNGKTQYGDYYYISLR